MVDRIEANRESGRKFGRPLLFVALLVIGLFLGGMWGWLLTGFALGSLFSLIVNDIYAEFQRRNQE